MKYEFSENIQRAILYLAKSSRDWYSQIGTLVKPEYFEFPAHSKMYRILQGYYEQYKELPTDDVILEECRQTLQPNQQYTVFTDEMYALNTLDVSALKHQEYYLDLIEDFARKEAMKIAIAEAVQLIKENKFGEVDNVIKTALSVSRSVNVGLTYFDTVDDRWNRTYNQEKKERFKGPLKTLNAALDGGIERGEMAIVMAPLGVGKSLFLVNQAVTSIMENKNVLYCSLEMSEDRIAQRIDSIMTLIPNGILRDNKEAFDVRLGKFRSNFPSGRLFIKQFVMGRADVNTIRALLTQLKNHEEFVPDIVIIDYLELLMPLDDGYKGREAQERVSQEIRGLAVEYQVALWTATQVNRIGRGVDIITDEHTADAYGKLRPADLTISLNQTQEEYDAGRMRTFVVKARNNRGKFLIPTSIDYNTLRITEGLPLGADNE